MTYQVRILVLSSLLVSSFSPCARAYDVVYSNYEQQFAEIEANDASPIPTDVPQNATVSGDANEAIKAASHNNLSLWNNDDSKAEAIWYSGLELMLLDPHYSTASFGIYDDSSLVGPRISLGRENESGYGWRTRFWYAKAGFDVVSDMGPVSDELAVSTTRFDFDFWYKRFVIPNAGTSITCGGGLSIARLAFDPENDFQSREIAAGPTLFVGGRTLTYRGTRFDHAFVYNGRWSAMGGTWKDRGRLGRTEGNGGLDILEISLGTEWIRKLDNSYWVFQYLFEAQSWDTTYFDEISFLGVSMGVNYYW